jgi:C4-type Zn-finger protein
MTDTIEVSCPNCGHALHTLRQERQQAGAREITLQWYICGECRHVALYDWSFVDVTDDGDIVRENKPRRTDASLTRDTD